MDNIGFIGCGKMAQAIIKGLLDSNRLSADSIMASKHSADNLDKIAKDLGIKVILDNKEVIKFSNIIFIAVKPNQVRTVLEEIKDLISDDKIIVSMAAGVRIADIESVLPKAKIIRIMPNTPVSVNEGITGICSGNFITKQDIEKVQELLNMIGKSVIIDENQIDLVTAISGSGPAFFYKVINEIARAGEKLGLDYEKSLLLSIQTAIGAGKMALNRNISMEDLISNVATKGGCTRVGVDKMADFDTENIFYEVIKNTAEKAKELG